MKNSIILTLLLFCSISSYSQYDTQDVYTAEEKFKGYTDIINQPTQLIVEFTTLHKKNSFFSVYDNLEPKVSFNSFCEKYNTLTIQSIGYAYSGAYKNWLVVFNKPNYYIIKNEKYEK